MKKRYILLFSLLAITALCSVYFIYRSVTLSSQLETTQMELMVEKEKNSGNALASIDSIFLAGDLTKALNAYKMELTGSDKAVASALKFRIRMIENFNKTQERGSDHAEIEQDSAQQRPDEIVNDNRSVDVRSMDSLNFALSKAKMQVENLKNQLRNSTKGAYLTFATSKGKNIHYVGEVKNQKADGKGIGLFDTGSRYDGEWKANMRQGEGKFFWPDGQWYEGSYLNDKRHGIGTYYWPNGEKYHGEWENDHRSGKGTFYGKEGEVIAKGIWKNDELAEVEKEN